MEDLNKVNNNCVEMSGEAALVVAARGGQAAVLRQLLAPSPHGAPALVLAPHQAAALYAAARSGQFEAVKYLIDYGTNVDYGDPEPPLIGALTGGHSDVAMLLIYYGADCEVKDARGNSCLHLACASGLYDVVRCLCAMGCIQGPNARGQYPLHIAARNGFIHIVRILCFYGCKIDQRNGDGIRADITALKYGHNDIADLLDKLRIGGWSASGLRHQLSGTGRPLARLQVRLLGHCGSGKSAFASSLNAGLLHALLRRSTSLTTRSRPSSPCSSSHIEMDFTPRHNSLSFDTCSTPHYTPTKGLQVHQMDINGVGDIAVWDFSGQEAYFQIFHTFLSETSIPQPASIPCSAKKKPFNSYEVAKYIAANDNVITGLRTSEMETNIDTFYPKPHYNCSPSLTSKYSQLAVYVIMFSLEKPYSIQLQQCRFWLNFILSRQPACSMQGGLGNAILVASHADLRTHKTPQGEYIYPSGDSLLQSIQEEFGPYFTFYSQVLALDCNASTSVGLRTFKTYLANIKRSLTQISLGYWNGFLEATLQWVINVRKSMESFPVMERKVFMDNVRSQVNLLASDEHIVDVIHYLHILGEVLSIGNVVVLSCSWLCGVLGALMGRGGLRGARALGVYTAHDFQAHFGYCDASQLLGLLQEMRLCSMCEVEDEIEYEFPCFNMVETLEGLWDSYDSRYQSPESCYGGIKLSQARGLTHLVANIFPHIQVQLREDMESLKLSDKFEDWGNDCDLYQWWHGSKLTWVNIECLLMLDGNQGEEYLDIRIRGPPGAAYICFCQLENVIFSIQKTLKRVAPGLLLERSIMSAHQVRTYCEEPYCWTTQQIITEMLECRKNEDKPFGEISFTNPNTSKKETLLNVVCFDSPTICDMLEWTTDMNIKYLGQALVFRLSGIMDPPHPLGADWCMLAVALGVSQDSIAAFDAEVDYWHTTKLLLTVNCTIGTLIEKLNELGRTDASDFLMSLSPIYRVTNYNLLDVSNNKTDDENSQLEDSSVNTTLNHATTGSKIHTDV